MIKNNFINNPAETLQALRDLSTKHQNYLSKEGKWLVGGFENLVSLEPDPKSTQQEHLHLKKEIYKMLPFEIREEIARIIDVD